MWTDEYGEAINKKVAVFQLFFAIATKTLIFIESKSNFIDKPCAYIAR
jgi:hypothetical protein